MMCLFLSISLYFSANTLIQHRVAPLLVLWGTYATFSPAGQYNLQDNIEMGISGHQMVIFLCSSHYDSLVFFGYAYSEI